MSFRLVPKSVTLNDLELHNGPYFALFHRTRVRCRRNKSSRSLSHLLMSFLLLRLIMHGLMDSETQPVSQSILVP